MTDYAKWRTRLVWNSVLAAWTAANLVLALVLLGGSVDTAVLAGCVWFVSGVPLATAFDELAERRGWGDDPMLENSGETA